MIYYQLMTRTLLEQLSEKSFLFLDEVALPARHGCKVLFAFAEHLRHCRL